MTTDIKYTDKIDFQAIKASVDIVQVIGGYMDLKRESDKIYRGLCPFHQEKTPSFTVYPVSQTFHCFGCGAGRDVFDFVAKYDGIEPIEAARKIAPGNYHPDPARPRTVFVPAPPKPKPVIAPEMIALYTKTYELARALLLTGAGKEVEDVRSYLDVRGFHTEDIRQTELGAYLPELREQIIESFPENLVKKSGLVSHGMAYNYQMMLPHYNQQGKISGLTFRIVKEGKDRNGEDLRKYKHTPDLDKSFLYNLFKAAAHIKGKKSVLVVEGHLDVQALALNGHKNVVGLGGSSMNKDQIEYLLEAGALQFVLWLDGDDAGNRGCTKALISMFAYNNLTPTVVSSKKFMDAGKINEDAERATLFKSCLKEAIPGGTWLGKHMTSDLSPLDRHNAIEEAADLIRNIKNTNENARFIASFGRGIGMSKSEFENELRELGVKLPTVTKAAIKTKPVFMFDGFYRGLDMVIRESGDLNSIAQYLNRYWKENGRNVKGRHYEEYNHISSLCKQSKLSEIISYVGRTLPTVLSPSGEVCQ